MVLSDSFFLNNYHELSIKELTGILQLLLYGPGAVPEGFSPHDFCTAITMKTNYTSKGAKASRIQNPYFRYAQKGLAYTLFGYGDSMDVASQRGLFFLYSMTHNQSINVVAFATDYLGRVGREDSGDISVRGKITLITEHFGYHTVLLEETPVVDKTKFDMSALIQQGMTSITHDYYSVMIHKRFINALPNLDRVSIVDSAN